MLRKVFLFVALSLFCCASRAFGYIQEVYSENRDSRHVITGTVLSFNESELRVITIVNDSVRFLHIFRLTENTKFIGELKTGKTVSVTYLRKRITKRFLRLIALTVEVVEDKTGQPQIQY